MQTRLLHRSCSLIRGSVRVLSDLVIKLEIKRQSTSQARWPSWTWPLTMSNQSRMIADAISSKRGLMAQMLSSRPQSVAWSESKPLMKTWKKKRSLRHHLGFAMTLIQAGSQILVQKPVWLNRPEPVRLTQRRVTLTKTNLVALLHHSHLSTRCRFKAIHNGVSRQLPKRWCQTKSQSPSRSRCSCTQTLLQSSQHRWKAQV